MATTFKVTVCPAGTLWLTGCSMMTGGTSTVSKAGTLFVAPTALLIVTR